MKIILFIINIFFFMNCSHSTEKKELKLNANSIDAFDKKDSIKVNIDTVTKKESLKGFENKETIPVKTSITIKQNDSSNILIYLPNNYSKKGDIDYTSYLQKAFNENKQITMPNFAVAINYNGIKVPSDRVVKFQEESKLIVLPNNKKNYQALLISNADNVEIINPNLVGDRDLHQAKEGEWGMGINILSSNKITIKNPVISKFWGDGIYIGKNNKAQNYCNNITIDGGVIDNNRRNGISVISAKNLTISNIEIKNTKGTSPMAGIDLEPNHNIDELVNIKFRNINTSNNFRGILIALEHFKGNSSKNISVEIDGHNDISSTYALALSLGNMKNPIPIIGNINITNVNWQDNKNPMQYYDLSTNKINVNIKRIKLFNQKSKIADLKNTYNKNKQISISDK